MQSDLIPLVSPLLATQFQDEGRGIKPSARIKNLDLYYGNFHALKNINLEIPENQITAFIGPAGCGKSTLLKSINRMNDMVEGCRIEGEILIHNALQSYIEKDYNKAKSVIAHDDVIDNLYHVIKTDLVQKI